jgi:methenyltetrahydrofolate cyclohydrolase
MACARRHRSRTPGSNRMELMKNLSLNTHPQDSKRFGVGADESITDRQPASLWELKANDLMRLVASDRPTPGGGSVAIMVACMGVALLSKAAAVSLRKDHRKSGLHEQLEEMLEGLKRGNQVLQQSADQDSTAFDSWVHALRLPRGNVIATKIREKSVEEAAVRASSIPIAAATTIRDLVCLGLRGLPLIHDVILSDAIAGLRLLNTSAVCLLATAEGNLSGSVKSPFHPEITVRLREIRHATKEADGELEHRLRNRALARSFSSAGVAQ